jgi:hypothetical protein
VGHIPATGRPLLGMGTRRFARGGIDGYDLGCPDYRTDAAPYYCTNDY